MSRKTNTRLTLYKLTPSQNEALFFCFILLKSELFRKWPNWQPPSESDGSAEAGGQSGIATKVLGGRLVNSSWFGLQPNFVVGGDNAFTKVQHDLQWGRFRQNRRVAISLGQGGGLCL
jgi:hypothetical protein